MRALLLTTALAAVLSTVVFATDAEVEASEQSSSESESESKSESESPVAEVAPLLSFDTWNRPLRVTVFRECDGKMLLANATVNLTATSESSKLSGSLIEVEVPADAATTSESEESAAEGEAEETATIKTAVKNLLRVAVENDADKKELTLTFDSKLVAKLWEMSKGQTAPKQFKTVTQSATFAYNPRFVATATSSDSDAPATEEPSSDSSDKESTESTATDGVSMLQLNSTVDAKSGATWSVSGKMTKPYLVVSHLRLLRGVNKKTAASASGTAAVSSKGKKCQWPVAGEDAGQQLTPDMVTVMFVPALEVVNMEGISFWQRYGMYMMVAGFLAVKVVTSFRSAKRDFATKEALAKVTAKKK